MRRLKFVWGASRVIKGRWYLGLFGLYNRVEGHREDGLAISVRGLLLWAGAGAVVCYLAAATALFWLWQRNPYSLLRYGDAVLYPFRQAAITEKKGQAFIAQGLDLMRQEKWHESANLLRLGLARYPRDHRARLTLSQYYVLLNQRAAALRWLEEGLTDEYPGRAYLEALFRAAEQGEDYAAVAAVAARYLPRLKREGPATDLRWVLDRWLNALLAAEQPAAALAVAEAEDEGDRTAEHRVLALLALHRPADAIAFLAEWQSRPGAAPSIIARLRVRAWREAGNFAEMERALAELRRLNPADPGPLVYAVVQQAMAGRDTEAAAAFDEFVFRFGGALENFTLLATPLAEIAHVSLLERCLAACAERGYPLRQFQTALVHAHVQRGEWTEAVRVLAGIEAQKGPEAASADAWRNWMQRLIDCARSPADAPRSALIEFLRERPWPVRVFRQTIETLVRSDRPEATREVVALAQRSFPASQWVERQAAALPPAPVRVEPVAPKRAAPAEPALAATPARKATAEAPLDDPEEVMAQLRLRQASGDRHGMLASARLYLNGDRARAQQMLEYAREIFAAGDRPAALALTREILRRTANYPPAQRQLAEWEPAEKK